MPRTRHILLVALVAWVLAGCNTVQGFAKDVKKAGGELEDAATK